MGLNGMRQSGGDQEEPKASPSPSPFKDAPLPSDPAAPVARPPHRSNRREPCPPPSHIQVRTLPSTLTHSVANPAQARTLPRRQPRREPCPPP